MAPWPPTVSAIFSPFLGDPRVGPATNSDTQAAKMALNADYGAKDRQERIRKERQTTRSRRR